MPFFESELRVRLSDTDSQGVVYYGRYYDFFDVSRLAMCRGVGVTLSLLRRRGLSFVAAESGCRYFGSARFDDLLSLRVGVASVGRSSVVYSHIIARGRRKLAEGRVVDVMVDLKGKPTPVPEDVRRRLAKYSV